MPSSERLDPRVLDTGYHRSRFAYDPKREAVWRAIVAYLRQRGIVPEDAAILELGAGYCHFINNVSARAKYALDQSEAVRAHAGPNVTVLVQRCDEPTPLPAESVDVVFASNLFEHLDREALDRTTAEAHRVLRRRGRLVLVQPNYRYCYREYFDDYTHVSVFSHESLADYLTTRDFEVTRIVPRFIPFSMKSRLPKAQWMVALYLRLPVRPFAGQMLVVGERP